MTQPEWIVEGAEVAEVRFSSWGWGGAVYPTTITKVGKRDIVLANGGRYSLKTLRRSGESLRGGRRLVSVNDPSVGRILYGNERLTAKVEVHSAWEQWNRNPDDAESSIALSEAALKLVKIIRMDPDA